MCQEFPCPYNSTELPACSLARSLHPTVTVREVGPIPAKEWMGERRLGFGTLGFVEVATVVVSAERRPSYAGEKR